MQKKGREIECQLTAADIPGVQGKWLDLSAIQVVFGISPRRSTWLRTTAITVLRVNDDSKRGLIS